MTRALNPTEHAMLSVITHEMTAKQAHYLLSKKVGRDVPASTASCALTNLQNWGLVSSRRKPRPDRKASRKIYRRSQ